jgi:DNA-binding response OmpR family regulator
VSKQPLALVADDIADIVMLIALTLERAGYRVVKVSDGSAAFAEAVASRPDLVILDVQMPGMDGYEVTEALRAREETRRTPLMLLSAHAHEADVRRGLEAGADDYLVKQFSPGQLLARVEALQR